MHTKAPFAPLLLFSLAVIACCCGGVATAANTLNLTVRIANSRTVYSQSRDGNHLLRLEGAGIQAQVPAGWKEKHDGQKIEFVSPNQTVYITFWVSESKDIGEASKELGRGVSILLDDPKFGAPQSGDLNGLPILVISGTGIYQGNPVDFNAGLIEAKKSVLMLVIGNTGAMDKYKGDLDHILKSVSRL